jgi:hypothetical protein
LEISATIVDIPTARNLMHAAHSQICEKLKWQFQNDEIKNVDDSTNAVNIK